jgi:hypothetical protein
MIVAGEGPRAQALEPAMAAFAAVSERIGIRIA